MSHYTHFTTEEREKSMVMIGQGKSIRMIAKELHRAPSSVSRELKRNANKDGSYSANTARRKYEKRRKNCHRKLLLSENEALRLYFRSNAGIGSRKTAWFVRKTFSEVRSANCFKTASRRSR